MRNPSLDVLRAAAVLLVFCYHSEGAILVGRFGWTGVDLFFVLSGYLVAGLLFREYQATGTLAPGRFLLRRGFKIYPPFYLLLLVTVAWGWARGGLPAGRLAAELLFVQNYVPGVWTHTWSLAIEEHFYLLLAGALWWAARRGRLDLVPRGAAGVCGLVLAMRLGTEWAAPEITELGRVFPTHLRIDSFMGGLLVAWYQTFESAALERTVRRVAKWLPQISMLLLAPVTFLRREDAFMVTWGFTLVSWGFVGLLVSVLYPVKRAKGAPGRGARAMAALGRHSYAFYLWHGPVILASDQLVRPWLGIPALLAMPVTFAVSYGLAVATTRWVEGPSLRLRDRWFPARVKVELPAAVPLGRAA